MLNNKNFYPTPRSLANKMLQRVKGEPTRILEPHAGKCDLVEAVEERLFGHSRHHEHYIKCIESDPDLQAVIRGKGYTLIDSDFLTYSAPDSFDLIIANPPFDNGDKHLMKAIEIMYNGQIVFLLNAETLRNPCTNLRKELRLKLNEHKAMVEFIPDAFIDAERKTYVEVALVSLTISNSLDQDMFEGMDDEAVDIKVDIQDKNEISTKKTIEELVLSYNEIIRLCTESVLEFMRNYPKVGEYLKIGFTGSDHIGSYVPDRTKEAQLLIDGVLTRARVNYWRKVLTLDAVKERLTAKKRDEFNDKITLQCKMDFTEKNIRQFILNLIGSYEQTLTEAVVDIFDRMTRKHAWDEKLHNDNVHYYNGWKTNDVFKVNKKVIIPIYPNYGHPFHDDWNGAWKLDYNAAAELHDIDMVMNYFDGMDKYHALDVAITQAFQNDTNKGESTYFRFKCHKKGTIHLWFKDENIRRRFNIAASMGKGWLPQDYGHTPLHQLPADVYSAAQAFEDDLQDYADHEGQSLFAEKTNQLKLSM